MVRTWIANIEKLKEPEYYRECYSKVPSFRKEKADEFRNAEDRCRSVGVWLLYEQIRKQYGYPETAAYNFSHSGDYVLCSVSDAGHEDVKVGCDIERVRKMKLLAAKKFCGSEYQKIMSEEPEEQTELFFRFWVLKESFLKATGYGLRMGLDEFEIEWTKDGKAVLKRQPDYIEGNYFYRELPVWGRPYKAAVCSTDEAIEPELLREIEL